MEDILRPPGTVAPIVYYEAYRWDVNNKFWHQIAGATGGGAARFATGEEAVDAALAHMVAYGFDEEDYAVVEVTKTAKVWTG